MPDLILLDSVPSTNDIVRTLARDGAPHGTAVLAASQTAGRGRMGRSFLSPEGGQYLSVLLRPELPRSRLPLVTPLAAVAVRRALMRDTGVDCGIKWVNDLLLNGKKVCGILCESLDGAVICGIGINLCQPKDGWPAELRGSVSALPGRTARTPLARAVISELLVLCAGLPSVGFLDEYRAHSVVLGRTVTVHDPSGRYPAFASEIDDDAGLCIITPDGTRRVLRAGEISVRIREEES